jgi:hypothetical protein
MRVRGVPIELDGEKVFFVPIEAGPAGDGKRGALWALWDVQDRYRDSPTQDDYKILCDSVYALAKLMLAPNYPADKVDEIAGSFPMGYADGLVGIALNARLPADFTTGAGVPDG